MSKEKKEDESTLPPLCEEKRERVMMGKNEETLSIITNVFENCVFIILSTTGKFGSLVRVNVEDGKIQLDDDEEDVERPLGGNFSFNTTYLLGDRDDQLVALVARQLMEKLREGKLKAKQLFLGLGLKKEFCKESDPSKLFATAKSVIEAFVKSSTFL